MRSLFIGLLALLLFGGSLTAAVQVVDTFDTGDFFLSDSGSDGLALGVASPLGSVRFAGINSRDFAPATTVLSNLTQPIDSITFDVDGVSEGLQPINLILRYSGSGPHDISSYTDFEVDLGAVVGSGFLVVELGSQSSYDSTTLRTPITSSGTLSVPFSSLNFGIAGSVDSFRFLNFTFEAESEQFSMTLEEIRLVPEPSASLLMVAGLAGVFGRRRRRGI